jgi:hypothetical protein
VPVFLWACVGFFVGVCRFFVGVCRVFVGASGVWRPYINTFFRTCDEKTPKQTIHSSSRLRLRFLDVTTSYKEK